MGTETGGWRQSVDKPKLKMYEEALRNLTGL